MTEPILGAWCILAPWDGRDTVHHWIHIIICAKSFTISPTGLIWGDGRKPEQTHVKMRRTYTTQTVTRIQGWSRDLRAARHQCYLLHHLAVSLHALISKWSSLDMPFRLECHVVTSSYFLRMQKLLFPENKWSHGPSCYAHLAALPLNDQKPVKTNAPYWSIDKTYLIRHFPAVFTHHCCHEK